MGFFKETGNLIKSLSGNLDARVDQGLWFLKNGQNENAMNCFSSASLKWHPNATRLWGERLIDDGIGHIDTLGGVMKLNKAITIGCPAADKSYSLYKNKIQVFTITPGMYMNTPMSESNYTEEFKKKWVDPIDLTPAFLKLSSRRYKQMRGQHVNAWDISKTTDTST